MSRLNKYFDFFYDHVERDFLEDFVVEEIELAGMDCVYIPRTMVSVDSILGEPYQSIFTKYYPIPMRLTTPAEGYGGEDIMSQFGLRFSNTSEWVVSKKMFADLKIKERPVRPLEGDLILVGPGGSQADAHFTYSMMEISYVKHDTPNWPLGKMFVWQLQCQLYVAAAEKFDTGMPDVDGISQYFGQTEELSIASNPGLTEKAKTLVDFSEENPFGNL